MYFVVIYDIRTEFSSYEYAQDGRNVTFSLDTLFARIRNRFTSVIRQEKMVMTLMRQIKHTRSYHSVLSL